MNRLSQQGDREAIRLRPGRQWRQERHVRLFVLRPQDGRGSFTLTTARQETVNKENVCRRALRAVNVR